MNTQTAQTLTAVAARASRPMRGADYLDSLRAAPRAIWLDGWTAPDLFNPEDI